MQRHKLKQPRPKTITGEIIKEATTPDKWSGLLSIGMNAFAFLFALLRLWELKAVRALWKRLVKHKKRRRCRRCGSQWHTGCADPARKPRKHKAGGWHV